MACCAWVLPSVVKAQDFREYNDAVAAYDEAEYERAVTLFERLVGTEPPLLDNEFLVRESRKYLGAAYMFVDREEEAERQFELLLNDAPDYEMEESFPQEIKRVFYSVRDRLQTVRAREEVERRRREAEVRAREIEALRQAQERELRLRELARTETVEVQNSRWVALVPFGVGQFQNDHDALGWIFAVSEGALAVSSIVLAVLWSSLGDEHPSTEELPEAELLERNLRVASQITGGAFWLTAIIGVIDAQLRFVPSTREERARELPEDLQEGTVDLGLGPTGVSLRLRF